MADVRRYAATPLSPWMLLHDVASRQVSGTVPLSTGADVRPLLVRPPEPGRRELPHRQVNPVSLAACRRAFPEARRGRDRLHACNLALNCERPNEESCRGRGQLRAAACFLILLFPTCHAVAQKASLRPVRAKQLRLLQHRLRRPFLFVRRVAVLARDARHAAPDVGSHRFLYRPLM